MIGVVYINPSQPDIDIINRAAEAIKNGGVVMFPSDTCYGLAANPGDNSAMRRLYEIKQRPTDKHVSVIFKDIGDIGKWTLLTDRERDILVRNLPGPFTFLLSPAPDYPLKGLVGARIPDSVLTVALSDAVNFPYTATSANISTLPPAYSVDEFLAQAQDLPDLILDAGTLPRVAPSTVVDLTRPEPKIIRQGSGELCLK